MTKQEAQQKFSDELIKELKETFFPEITIAGSDYAAIKDIVLNNYSISVLQSQFPLTITEYIALAEKQEFFTLFETQVINTLIMSRTPNDFPQGATQYIHALSLAVTVGEKYNELVQPISETIKARLEIMGIQGLWGQRQKLVN